MVSLSIPYSDLCAQQIGSLVCNQLNYSLANNMSETCGYFVPSPQSTHSLWALSVLALLPLAALLIVAWLKFGGSASTTCDSVFSFPWYFLFYFPLYFTLFDLIFSLLSPWYFLYLFPLVHLFVAYCQERHNHFIPPDRERQSFV
jgi:hypothetical protein